MSIVMQIQQPSNIMKQFDALLTEVPENHFLARNQIAKGLEKYNDEELRAIYQDFLEIRKMIFNDVKELKEYTVTAGGPGAGKSRLLEELIQEQNSPSAYIDPDRRALLHMSSTYKKDREKGTRNAEDAYLHWRDASNFMANYFLAIALKMGVAIDHGSTMTPPSTITQKVLGSISNDYGYSIKIIHVTAPDQLRYDSIKNRREETKVVQETDTDVDMKGKAFYDRLPDYIACADRIDFYFRGEMGKIVKAAEWTKDKGLNVLDENALAKIEFLHDKKKGEGYWKKAVRG